MNYQHQDITKVAISRHGFMVEIVDWFYDAAAVGRAAA
jgi:hypothetical protein